MAKFTQLILALSVFGTLIAQESAAAPPEQLLIPPREVPDGGGLELVDPPPPAPRQPVPALPFEGLNPHTWEDHFRRWENWSNGIDEAACDAAIERLDEFEARKVTNEELVSDYQDELYAAELRINESMVELLTGITDGSLDLEQQTALRREIAQLRNTIDELKSDLQDTIEYGERLADSIEEWDNIVACLCADIPSGYA